MKLAIRLGLLVLLAGLAVWLFMEEEAAQPGPLVDFHAAAATCRDCHTPWQGVRTENCLGCHQFKDPEGLERELRFHQAEKYCTGCHREHRGGREELTRMDHTLLHPDLLCSQCHVDPHEELFGEQCRACHRIDTWRVRGYRHPPAEQGQCARCHRAPVSHQDPAFWERLTGRYETEAAPEACGECHEPHEWSYIRLAVRPPAGDGPSPGGAP